MGEENIQNRSISGDKPLCISVPMAAKWLGVSRNTGYTMVKLRQLPVIMCGKRRLLVPVAALMKKLQTEESV